MTILFPPFVSLYNNGQETIIYYFRGLDNNYKWMYQEFKEDQIPKHKKVYNDDGSIMYIFSNKINSINCHLVSNDKLIKDKFINIKI